MSNVPDCAAITAEELRQRRKDRILRNSDDRVSQILHQSAPSPESTNPTSQFTVNPEITSNYSPVEDTILGEESVQDIDGDPWWYSYDFTRIWLYFCIGVAQFYLHRFGIIKYMLALCTLFAAPLTSYYLNRPGTNVMLINVMGREGGEHPLIQVSRLWTILWDTMSDFSTMMLGVLFCYFGNDLYNMICWLIY